MTPAARHRRALRSSIPGRLTLLLLLPLTVGAGAAALASAAGASPWMVFLVGCGVGFPLAAVLLSRALAPSLALLEALSDGVDSWLSRDFSLRLAQGGRRDELGRLVELYNSMGSVLRRERNELRQREILLGSVIETSPAAVLLLSSRGYVELANRQARRLLGENRRLEGQNWAELPLPAELQHATEASTDQLLTLDLEGVEETFHISRRDLELNARPHRLLMIHRVTTELRRQEIAAWKKVLRVIAHELNNSLAPIRSVARTARQMLEADHPRERLSEALETIDDSAARLHQFIDGYVRFARLPAPRLESIDLLDLVHELQRLEPFTLTQVPEDGPVPCRADPAQLQQALINLVRNAREASGTSEALELRIESRGPGGVRLEILDRGPGMEPETLRRALLPFYSTKPEGTGLGLALAREIVEAHGGRLSLANRPEGGLRVSCWLPQS